MVSKRKSTRNEKPFKNLRNNVLPENSIYRSYNNYIELVNIEIEQETNREKEKKHLLWSSATCSGVSLAENPLAACL